MAEKHKQESQREGLLGIRRETKTQSVRVPEKQTGEDVEKYTEAKVKSQKHGAEEKGRQTKSREEPLQRNRHGHHWWEMQRHKWMQKMEK